MSDEVTQGEASPEAAVVETPEPNTYAQELEAAAADLGPSKPQNGVTLKSKKKEEEPKAEEPKAEPAPVITQERLSSGYAKLERQKKAVAKKEAELAAREAEIAKRQEELEKTTSERTSAIEARASEVDKLLKLFDEDEEACLSALAERRKTTVDAFYDKLTRRRLNGGVRAPEDQVAEVRAEVEALKKEKAEKEAAEKEAAEKAAKEKEAAEQRAKFEARIQAENAGYIKYVRECGKYPLLCEEKDEDIIGTARALIQSATSAGQNVGYDEVAGWLEKQCELHKLKEEAEARAAAEAETPKKSAPKSEGKKTEPAKAKTLTNNASIPRNLKSEGTPLTEEERHNRALAMWK